MDSVAISATKVRQPIGVFFIGSVPSEALTKVAYADVRRIEARDVEKHLGIQRPLNMDRVKEIASYVQTKDASFPTAIILAVDGACATWDDKHSSLTLSSFESESDEKESIPLERIAKILDGQHRIAGLMEAGIRGFEVNVSIFVDIDIAEQANIFATVNLAQTKVNKSLVYDLFELAKTRSPQKTSHAIAVVLDERPKSPFHGRIKRLGVATQGRFNETLTQATVVEAILPYIGKDPNKDRDLLLRGKKLERASDVELKKYIFRNLFIDEEDDEIMKIVWSYFVGVQERWPKAWKDLSQGSVLPKTNGFRAFMRFLRPAYLSMVKKIGDEITVGQVQSVLGRINLRDADFNTTEFQPGTSGESKLFRRLLRDSHLG
jgi:DGQHR domain-containing protein